MTTLKDEYERGIVPRTSTVPAPVRAGDIDSLVRRAIQSRSLQSVDAWARLAGLFLPRIRDLRELRLVAVTGAVAGLMEYTRYATRGTVEPRALIAALDSYASGDRSPRTHALLQRLHHRRAQRLAWLMLNLHTTPHHLARAEALLQWVLDSRKRTALTSSGRATLVECQMLQGRYAHAQQHATSLATHSDFARRAVIDFANPHLSDTGDAARWRTALATMWTSQGHAAVTVRPEAMSPFLGLAASAPPRQDAEVVSVVVSAYRPGPGLIHAVESVLASSWSALEILVVDDASGPEFHAAFAEVAAKDPRVRVHTMSRNGGTYAIRNWALTHASGTFLTFHDSDDWMHPERIETQVDFLRSNPSHPACTTLSARVTSEMAFVNGRSLGIKLCEPSLLFERERTLNRVGLFDAVRIGADAEYRQRIEASYGTPVPTIGTAPMTLQLVDAASLSGGDIRRYYVALHRRIYRACYEQWHRQRRSRRLPVYLDSEASGQREFYAPDSVRGVPADDHVEDIIAADLLDGKNASRIRREVRRYRRMNRSGVVGGIRHVGGSWHRGGMRVNVPREVIDALNDGVIVLDERGRGST